MVDFCPFLSPSVNFSQSGFILVDFAFVLITIFAYFHNFSWATFFGGDFELNRTVLHFLSLHLYFVYCVHCISSLEIFICFLKKVNYFQNTIAPKKGGERLQAKEGRYFIKRIVLQSTTFSLLVAAVPFR